MGEGERKESYWAKDSKEDLSDFQIFFFFVIFEIGFHSAVSAVQVGLEHNLWP